MEQYRHKKSKFWISIIFLFLFMFIIAFIGFIFFPTYQEALIAAVIVSVGNSIFLSISLFKGYKSSTILTEDKITITSRGRKNTIAYKDIMYIEYRGIPHCFLGDNDSMILHCGSAGKIYVEATYENYMTLWNQIIEKAKENNPRLTVSPRMEKRMKKQKNTDDSQH